MASGHDSHDDHGHEPHDDHGHGHDDHGHGHDDHHDDHSSGGEAWVLAPIIAGFIVGAVLVVLLGLGNDASAFLH